MDKVTAAIKRYFISGVLVVVPMILTFIVLKFLFETIDNILGPILVKTIGYDIPLIGVAALLLIIFAAGVIVRSYFGHRLYSVGDRLLARVPLIRPIYSAAKQLLEAIAGPDVKSFKEVALIEYPRRGSWSLCFISNWVDLALEGEKVTHAVAFIPSTPTPISGMVVLVPENEVFALAMTIEEGVKFLVSGGVASPSLIMKKAETIPGSE